MVQGNDVRNIFKTNRYQNTLSIYCTVTVTIAAATALLEFLPFFLHNHLFSFIYPSVSLCMVLFLLLKPLKSNCLQFLEEASTGQCVGAIPYGPNTIHTN